MSLPSTFRQAFGRHSESLEPAASDLAGLGQWQRMVVGGGALELTGSSLRLATTDTSAQEYSNAQIDDYQSRARRDFLWRPPLAITFRVRFSHGAAGAENAAGLRGTAGFGFWNDPFMMTGRRFPTLPRALWFFYASPPSDMKLDFHTPGYGWKAATIDALHPSTALLAFAAPLAVPLMNADAVYRVLWPAAQRALRISEALAEVDMTCWHVYTIEWGIDRARFRVDGAVVLDCDTPPRGPLGLVIWLDNQYLVAAPWGRLRYGLLATPGRQWLELDWLEITA